MAGRQQSGNAIWPASGHRRGLRPGHAFKGVIRELERAVCLPAERERYEEDIRPEGEIPASRRRPRHCDESAKAETQMKKTGKAGCGLLIRRQEQYRNAVRTLKKEPSSLIRLITRTSRHEPVQVTS